MAIAVSITGTDFLVGNEIMVLGTLTLTGNYGGGATNGDTINLTGFDQIKSSLPPVQIEIFEMPAAGTAATGYSFIFSPGTTLANGVVQLFNGITQYAQGSAYGAGQLGAVIKFRAYFPNV
jgi:X-X-X-Leu-X-X-Gly heptad repeat protein